MAAALRGDSAAARTLASRPADDVRAWADHHRIVPLLADALAGQDDASPARAALQADATAAAAADMLREHELRRLLAAFRDADLDVLLIKGGQLAYAVYARPDLRSRMDTDLFIAAADRERADATLRAHGYTVTAQAGGELVFQQACYTSQRQGRVVHAVDLHWRIANPAVFATVLTFDEAWAEALAIPSLGDSARGLSVVHALFLACVHRVAHHYGSDCLLWLFDIHLLAAKMPQGEWTRFVALAADRRVAAVGAAGLRAARDRFGTIVPDVVLAELDQAAAGEEPSAEYLEPRRRVDDLVADLRALPRWRERVQLVREHLFPPRRYMLDVYAPSSHAPLAVLYARRAWRGARKWLIRDAHRV